MFTDQQRSPRFESETRPAFTEEIASSPGGEAIRSCIQCGTCAGTCPLSEYMDRSPRAVINLIRAGFKKEVLEGNTHWICASCYSCGIECPQQIHITDVMYALKRVAIREGAYPKRLPAAVLAKEFTKMAVRRGRVNEAWLVVQLNLRTNWLNFLKMARLGLELVRTGRIAVKPESIKNRQQLAAITQPKEPAKGGRVS